jgi:hypothetical protein
MERRRQDMRRSVSLLGCVVRLIGSRALLAVAIGVLIFGISFTYAQTSPPIPLVATSSLSIYVQCGDQVPDPNHIKNNSTSKKPTVDDDLQLSCGPRVQDWGGGKTVTMSASGTVGVRFVELAGGVPSVLGKLTGNAVTSFDGWTYGQNNANAGVYGYFWYYFNIVRGGTKGSNPPWVPPTIPILFTARGKASVEQGRGYFDVYAVVGMYGTVLPTSFPKDLFRITPTGKPAPYTVCFGGDPNNCQKSVTLDLPVNNSAQPYQVQLTAGMPFPGTMTPYQTGWQVSKNVSKASVYVDSSIPSLDQATFNTKCAQQGKTPFALSDYYKLVVSPNLSIQ